jgi:hypothetical protein
MWFSSMTKSDCTWHSIPRTCWKYVVGNRWIIPHRVQVWHQPFLISFPPWMSTLEDIVSPVMRMSDVLL